MNTNKTSKKGNIQIRFTKRFFLFLVVIFLFFKGFAQDFEVKHCNVNIYIHEDGYFDVIENYDINFTAYKHGIYRDIQINYNLITEEGKQEKRRIKIKKIDVPGHKYQVAPYFVQRISDNLQIKIGDKDVTVIGPQQYQIKYRVYNAFLFEGSQIRFYWNVKPDGWHANFNQLDFNIHLPTSINANLGDISIYSGNTGKTSTSNDFEVNYIDGIFTARSHETFLSLPGQSVTVLLNLPLGSIKEIKPLWPFWNNYGWTLILGTFLLLFYWIWNKYGKDDYVVAATSYFPPNGMDPAMAGFLIDDSEDTKDLISLIPYWGSRGIIKLEEIPGEGWFGKGDTKITRLKPLPIDASDYEEKIFIGLFGSTFGENEKEVMISSLKDSFYTTMASAKKVLKDQAQVYYDATAKKIQTKTIVGVLIGGILILIIFLFTWGLWAALTVIPLAIFLLFMTVHLVKKNSKGNKVYSELKGFKQFIKVAEANKLKMLLQDSPSYFETTMSYALAFGLFDQWVQKFEALDIQPPSWYTSYAGAYTMHNFANSFSKSISTAQSTMVSSPSSSGSGGSSGGGFGGGGGGSW